MYKAVTAVLIVTALLVSSKCCAVAYENLQPRDRILIRGDDGKARVEGRVVRAAIDTLFIVPMGQATQYVWPVREILELRIWRGRRTSWIEGLGIGIVAGGLVGFASVQSTDDGERALGTIFGGMIGGIAGFTIGALIQTDDWQEVALPPE